MMESSVILTQLCFDQPIDLLQPLTGPLLQLTPQGTQRAHLGAVLSYAPLATVLAWVLVPGAVAAGA
jgi:hypothetical protein